MAQTPAAIAAAIAALALPAGAAATISEGGMIAVRAPGRAPYRTFLDMPAIIGGTAEENVLRAAVAISAIAGIPCRIAR